MNGPLLTADQVAEQLGITRRFVWRLAREDKLPRVELGPKCVRFDPADVDAFIEERRAGPRARRAHVESPERPAGKAGKGKGSTAPRRMPR
jgi:excisionase family DNA binding protein